MRSSVLIVFLCALGGSNPAYSNIDPTALEPYRGQWQAEVFYDWVEHAARGYARPMPKIKATKAPPKLGKKKGGGITGPKKPRLPRPWPPVPKKPAPPKKPAKGDPPPKTVPHFPGPRFKPPSI